jgi:hypothetical protein
VYKNGVGVGVKDGVTVCDGAEEPIFIVIHQINNDIIKIMHNILNNKVIFFVSVCL